jgi:hypothetical protein
VIIDTLTSLWIWYIDCNICQLSPREYTKNSDHEMIVIRRHRWTTSSGSLIHVTCAFHHEIWYIIFFSPHNSVNLNNLNGTRCLLIIARLAF